ncbi:hypothetical protein OE88DRAFT_226 [Heliocybe sulcata]|uniref:DUF6534 domain-containing protein n=1 Tax=Heliocybe sulcata TaxID=5364 RepID=A0A5C3NJK6_9AGAM|nr:hypothetical protein OE88DRAFT_226 [Heliocybe sulcata]
MQAYLYFRTFKMDYWRIRAPVLVVWLFDVIHSGLICGGSWRYLIQNFGNDDIVDFIPLPIGLTVLVTATITFIVQTFFTNRVLVLSKKNWYICGPMFLMALCRLVAAIASTGLMIHLRSFDAFVFGYAWVFTLGLCCAATLDILITVSLCWYLTQSRTGISSMDQIVDAIMVYTINNGILTCVCTVISLICWVVMPHNLIFLGIHFALSKLYANSFLATINTRETLRERSHASSERGHPLPVLFPHRSSASNRFLDNSAIGRATKLEINVEKTIQHEIEIAIDAPYAPSDLFSEPGSSSTRHTKRPIPESSEEGDPDPTPLT